MARRFLAAVPALLAIALFSLPLAATTTTAATTGDTAAETATTASLQSGTTAAETGTTGDGTGTTGDGTGTTEATAPAVTIQPAVPVDTTPPEQTNPDWTYRFFIPTLLVLAALVVIVTVIQYFTRVVRNRYRTVR